MSSYETSQGLALVTIILAIVIFVDSIIDECVYASRRYWRLIIVLIWVFLGAGLFATLTWRDKILWKPVEIFLSMLILNTRCPVFYKAEFGQKLFKNTRPGLRLTGQVALLFSTTAIIFTLGIGVLGSRMEISTSLLIINIICCAEYGLLAAGFGRLWRTTDSLKSKWRFQAGTFACLAVFIVSAIACSSLARTENGFLISLMIHLLLSTLIAMCFPIIHWRKLREQRTKDDQNPIPSSELRSRQKHSSWNTYSLKMIDSKHEHATGEWPKSSQEGLVQDV